MGYKPKLESIRRHRVPKWFHDAKLGIFVHWGLYSVPGWAPLTGDITKVIAKEGWKGMFAKNPYAEWYLNSIRIRDSPSYHHHVKTYGESFSYDDFAPLFNESIRDWNPNDWADLFKRAGARYVVLTTKHHDGFCLWPTQHSNPRKEGYFAKRDIVGELAQAVRARGMRMGLYYSHGLDWTFSDTPIRDFSDLFATIPQNPEYVEYVNSHWRELIDRYETSILWGDIACPVELNLRELFAYYYNKVSEGVINDRFSQIDPVTLAKWASAEKISPEILPASIHFDFRTPEYASRDKITEEKWESCRGIGYSFGYNRNEGPEDMLSFNDLIHLLVDIVSKNGNLLLDVGPMADGAIPDLQRTRLLELGRWLNINGEAIYGTRPWVRADGITDEGIAVRFTQKRDALYAILLGRPKSRKITLKSLNVEKDTTVHLLGESEALSWRQAGDDLTITIPEDLTESPAYAFRITPKPKKVSS